MKADIHPTYQPTTMKCICGAEYSTRSTDPDIRVEVCAACHPFFSGKAKVVDSTGRIEKFKKKYNIP